MLSLDGPEHARHRAPFVAPLRLGAVRATLAGAVREEAALLLDALEPAGEAELRRGFAGPLAAAVVTRSLGLSHADVGAVLGHYDAIVGAVSDLSAGRPARARGGRGDARRSAARAAARRHRRLAEHEYVSNAAVMLFGGIETTEGMIANALVHLLAHGAARTRRCDGRRRGVAAARAGRRGGRPLRDRGHRARRRGDRRRRPRADLDHRRQPRPGDVPRPRPLRPRSRQRAAPPRVRGRAARVRRDAPRAPGGARGARAAARAPAAAAPGPARPPRSGGSCSASPRRSGCRPRLA